ncbi:sugar phosphate isomerase/epimerase [Mucilaginibacter sp.]|uniref:sugar phosphate isomerase/epimerase family protein n=1 Tax=Mucilaginibacter sp. TaxID=1882438 RepID=UPI00260EA59B|nr:sugar phosphate isomerase/epimerase [Mucilaginibacter sp.]MDB4918915.1 sugar phosphate isomerase/epimerase [Mucilaginibacter sp.]
MKTNSLNRIKLIAVLLACFFSTDKIYAQLLFPQKPGVVSYTYRKYFEKDVPSTLDMIKANGFTDIEFSNLFGKTAPELRVLLDERGLKCSSFGVGYEDFINKTTQVAQNAKALGADYVRVAGIPHKGTFTPEEAQRAIDDFNRTGKLLKEQYGLSFVYHNHGFEFEPYKTGTLFDLLVEQTNPEYVSFELDVLWAFFPGQDPAKLLYKYPGRFKLMHLKDLKKGVKGDLSGGTSQDNDVALGTGQMDIPAILKAAKKAGIQHYYIEDESNNIIEQVPASIAYLKSLTE